MDKNYGHDVLWSSGKFDSIIKKSFYIVSDPDIAENKNLRPDFIKEFYRLLGEYPNVVKVGFALEKDDLPENGNKAIVKKGRNSFGKRNWTMILRFIMPASIRHLLFIAQVN